MLYKKIAPPLYDASESKKSHKSIIPLVELTHEMEPPFLIVIAPLNVTLYIFESLQFTRDNAPFEWDSVSIIFKFKKLRLVAFSQ